MARIDKAHFVFRGTAGTALTGIIGVTVNTGGSVVPAGSANARGIVVLPGTIAAGRVVGVLRHGEVVEFGGTAGTKYYAALTTGSIGTAAAADSTFVGFTVEGDRLIVTM